MDTATILESAKRSRTYVQEVDGRLFEMLMPTDHDVRIAYIRFGSIEDLALWSIIMRELLEHAIRGWSKVTADDLLRNGVMDKVEFDPELVPVLLDARDDWYGNLANELTTRLADRKKNTDVVTKN